MKKILSILIITFLFIPNNVLALSANGSVKTTIENGSNVTFYVNVNKAASWNLHLKGSGATSGCYKKYADVTEEGNNTSKRFTVTCKANKIGKITFTATGDITASNGQNINVSITKVVNVVKAREKEKEARLLDLSIQGYNINFNKDKTNYSISIQPTVNSINIKATPISKYAKVSGIGVKKITGDGDIFKVISISETGVKKEYTINVSIIDSDPINVEIDNKKYTVVKTSRNLIQPLNTETSTIKINNYEIPSFINEKAKLTLVGLKDEDGNIKYGIYKDNKYELYNENKSNELSLFINNKELKGYNKKDIKINDNTYEGYELDDRFVIVYAMNLNNGEYNYYKYDTKENTFQYYDIKDKVKKENNINIFLYTTIIFAITTLILLISKKTKID